MLCLSFKKKKKKKRENDYLLECNLPFVVTHVEGEAVKKTEPVLGIPDGITELLWSAYLNISPPSSKVVCSLAHTCFSYLLFFLFFFFFLFCVVASHVFGCGRHLIDFW